MEDKQGLTLEEIVKMINDMDEIAVSDPIIHDLIIKRMKTLYDFDIIIWNKL